jgi:hypothetical protein
MGPMRTDSLAGMACHPAREQSGSLIVAKYRLIEACLVSG